MPGAVKFIGVGPGDGSFPADEVPVLFVILETELFTNFEVLDGEQWHRSAASTMVRTSFFLNSSERQSWISASRAFMRLLMLISSMTKTPFVSRLRIFYLIIDGK